MNELCQHWMPDIEASRLKIKNTTQQAGSVTEERVQQWYEFWKTHGCLPSVLVDVKSLLVVNGNNRLAAARRYGIPLWGLFVEGQELKNGAFGWMATGVTCQIDLRL